MNCPDPHCQYASPHPHRMKHHLASTGHGRKTIREFRGHLSTGGGQKKKVEVNGAGGKGKKGRK